jgi:acyl-CoA synthetase (AMP-forming)/AMP-acid ligase II
MLVHLAVIQELITRLIPDREAIIWRDGVLSYAAFLRRCRQVGHGLRTLGLGCHTERGRLDPWESGQDHVAVCMHNCPEWLEVMYGSYHARAVMVNVNYRYKADELRYVLANSSARALVYQGAFAPLVAEVRPALPTLRHLIQMRDDSDMPLLPGALDYEELRARQPTDPLDLPYAPDDLYILYTGGTTGIPKGVLWRQEDVFFNGLGGHVPGFERLDSEEKLRSHVTLGIGGRAIVLLPFMHGAGQWLSFNSFHRGGTLVFPDEGRRLDAEGAWRTVERHQVDQMMIIGDAFARPLIAALRTGRYDVSSVRVVGSTAAVLSPAVKQELMALLPEGTLSLESIGGSEMGLQAMSYDTDSGQPGVPAYQLRENTVLLRSDRSGVLSAGTDELGWIATRGHLPLGYLGDPDRTRQTFPVIEGVRYCVGGDRGRYTADGRVLFLGREAVCINTGGEKVFAEEVERIVKSHPAVYDALVVGVRSERWGQQVTALVSINPGSPPPTVADLRDHCAAQLADYKLPKAVIVVPEIVRSPSGKPDYVWALDYAGRAAPA